MKLEPNEVSLSSAVHACALAKRWRLGLSRGFLQFISIPWAWRLFRRSHAPKGVLFARTVALALLQQSRRQMVPEMHVCAV